jgi:outer membrane lipoprotein
MMKRMFSLGLASCIAVLQLAGCSPPFSPDLLDRVDRTVAYGELQKDPDRFTGRVLMLGGVIVEARNLKEGTQLEVLQQPLDGRGRPLETDETGGRFLVIAEQFLDTAVFHRGRAVTVIGEVVGKQTRPLGQIEYRYALLKAKAVHLWPPEVGPQFSIGVGVYHGF